jgi:hypothetical protein
MYSVLHTHLKPFEIHPSSLVKIQDYIDALALTHEIAPCTMTHVHTPSCSWNAVKVFGRVSLGVIGPLYLALNGAPVVLGMLWKKPEYVFIYLLLSTSSSSTSSSS